MLTVPNRLAIQIFFDDQELPLTDSGRLDFVHMSASTRLGVPMLHMAFTDTNGWLDASGILYDGVPITVACGPGTISSGYRFRMHSYSSDRTPEGTKYELDAYLDAPLYWNNSPTQSFTGTSNSVLASIASSAGFDYVGQPTIDTQTWDPMNTTYHEFARMVANHGYRGEGSCMKLGLDLNRQLIYRDVMEVTSPVAKFYQAIVPQDEAGILVRDMRPSSDSGLGNKLSGYSDTISEQSVLSTPDPVSSLPVKVPSGSSLDMSSDLKSSVKKSRVRFTPINCGNTHSESTRALYQNERLSNLFCSNIELVTTSFSGIRILDRVSFTAVTSHLRSPTVYSGDYWVASRSIYIKGIDYYEKFQCCSMG